jgi:hypothetical protein
LVGRFAEFVGRFVEGFVGQFVEGWPGGCRELAVWFAESWLGGVRGG